MDERARKRCPSGDGEVKKRRKKNPYGGDILMQIAAKYARRSPTPPPKTISTQDAGTAIDLQDAGEATDRDEKKIADDDMVGDARFFAARRMLPVWKARHEILQALEHEDVLILTGEAGSGKSTQVPQILCSAPWCTKKIGVTQPRRIAATSLARRVASEMGTPLDGKNANAGSVGYAVRFDAYEPKDMRIKYLTEGKLLQELLEDKALSEYSAIIVDEVHERSINVDLVLGFLRLILDANRPGATQDAKGDSDARRRKEPLKVILMSATADVDKLHELFSPTAVEKTTDTPEVGRTTPSNEVELPGEKQQVSPAPSPSLDKVKKLHVLGRQYPIDIIYEKAPVHNLVQSVAETVLAINKSEEYPGDVLVFLQGQDEIYNAASIIESKASLLPSNLPRIEVLPLYSQLPKKQQDKVLRPVRQSFTRRVILATNIAETSVTVPGVRYVVDSGFAKSKSYDAGNRSYYLGKLPISKSAAIQRAGRAGREKAGKCFRLYTQHAFDGLATSDTPEILRSSVVDTVLIILASGGNPMTFPLLSKPSRDALWMGYKILFGLGGALEAKKISADGLAMARMPLSASYARVILEAQENDCLLEAIDIIACLTMNGVIFIERNDHADGLKDPQKDGQKNGDSDKDKEDEGSEDDTGLPSVDKLRAELKREQSDLLTIYTTLNRMLEQKDRKWKAWCEERLIHEGNMKQALRIRNQLRNMCVDQKRLGRDMVPAKWSNPKFVPMSPEKEERLLKAFLRGFGYNTAKLMPDGIYETSSKQKISIHASSVLRGRKPPAIVYMDNVWSGRNYARIVSAVDPAWIDEISDHWGNMEEPIPG